MAMLVGLLAIDDSGKIKYFKQEDVGTEKACLSIYLFQIMELNRSKHEESRANYAGRRKYTKIILKPKWIIPMNSSQHKMMGCVAMPCILERYIAGEFCCSKILFHIHIQFDWNLFVYFMQLCLC